MYYEGDYERQVMPIADGQAKAWRGRFKRDYGRIIHSASFRRQQGKTQVFPGHESDFFRNRLTHSLEVAQIAEGIADRINHHYELGERSIDERLCATAGLIHDIGHPPFGHNGERALDDKMRDFGGFEGNAQTLRILCRIDKKARYESPYLGDDRAGMNLCWRTLASVLKYDRIIPETRPKGSKLAKGYYATEEPIVDKIKEMVLRGKEIPSGEIKTIECAIMDLADDIAYSVYDLEDSLKAGFLTPASILSRDQGIFWDVAKGVSDEIGRPVSTAEVISTFVEIFDNLVPDSSQGAGGVEGFIEATRSSNALSANGYLRTKLSSQLVHEFINGVEFQFNDEYPALSRAYFNAETKMKVEVLKQFTYKAIISSYRVKLGEYRGTALVSDLFDVLMEKRGDLLMPDDVRENFNSANSDMKKARVVSDFIAGMTDRYAVEFWSRLKSDTAESIFKSI